MLCAGANQEEWIAVDTCPAHPPLACPTQPFITSGKYIPLRYLGIFHVQKQGTYIFCLQRTLLRQQLVRARLYRLHTQSQITSIHITYTQISKANASMAVTKTGVRFEEDTDALRVSSIADARERGEGNTAYERKCILINREIDAMV